MEFGGEFLRGATGLGHVLGPQGEAASCGDRVGRHIPAAEIQICPFPPTPLVVVECQLGDRTEVWKAYGEMGPLRDPFSNWVPLEHSVGP